MPAVVAQRAQEGLVDGPTDELRGERGVGQHIEERVRLVFDPEAVAELDAVCRFVGERFACVGDDGGVVRAGDGADVSFESAREETVP